MNNRNFHLLINSFEVITRNNYKLTYSLSQHLLQTLALKKTESGILPLYNFYVPIHQQFKDAYQKISNEKGNQLSSTLQLKQLLKGLTKKINKWDLAMLVHFEEKDTADYKKLMNGGHTSFMRGKYDNRITRVTSLSINLTNLPELATTKLDVDDYLLQLNTAYDNQTKLGSNSNKDVADLETERINVCDGQLYVLGGLYQKYYKNPAEVGTYFHLHKMKQHRQVLFNGSHLHPMAHKKVLKRTFKNNQLIVLKNKGNTTLRFYLTHRADSKVAGDIYIDVAARTQQKRKVADLGDNAKNKYLNVQNTDTKEQGAYEVELVLAQP